MPKGKTTKKCCEKCNNEISLFAYKRHYNSCTGNYDSTKVKKVRGIDYDPNRGYRDGTRTAWNKGLIGDSRCARKGIVGHPHSNETKALLSALAKERGFGGYRENAGKSKKYKVLDSFGNQATLQSSYELKCSEILNDLNIKWLRPKALKYNGRNYFADFYLPDFDIYLDPKNNYKAKLDAEKIQLVQDQNNVRVYILLKDQLTPEYLKCLCS